MNKNAFTLVELLVVITIIGILSLLILPDFISSFNNAKNKAMLTQEHEVIDASKLFIEDFCRNPLPENKGNCQTFSLDTSEPNIKYTCLDDLQRFNYIDPIISQGQKCYGFVIYKSDYKDIKAYLSCGNSYTTDGADLFKNNLGDSLIDVCSGLIAISN